MTIKNKNEDLALDFNFTKVAHFRAFPNKGKLLPGTKHSINISFEPKNFGVFEQLCFLEILNGVYKFPLKLMGSSSAMGQKTATLRGPNAMKADFEPSINPIKEDEMDAMPKTTKARKTQGNPGDLPRWL